MFSYKNDWLYNEQIQMIIQFDCSFALLTHVWRIVNMIVYSKIWKQWAEL